MQERRFDSVAFKRRGEWPAATALGVLLVLLGVLDAHASLPIVHDDAIRSAGCAPPAVTRTAGYTEVVRKAQDGNNRQRTYLLHTPATYVPTNPYSLVFVFHGAAGKPRDSYSVGFQNVEGAKDNAIFVFPEGIQYQNIAVGWDDAGNGYDLPFFDHMLSEIKASYCIDTTRVFAAGGSWGGDFVIALACHRGDKLRAAEVNSAGDEYKDRSNYATYQGMPCPTKKHPKILFEHAVGADAAYPAPDFATTSQLFRHLNSCDVAGRVVEPHTRVMSCVEYNSCSTQYTECFFDSAIGHAEPPNLARDTWNFFSAS